MCLGVFLLCLSSWVGPGLNVKMTASRRAHTTRYFLGPPHLSHTRRSRSCRWVWPRLLWSHCFVLGPLGPSACETLCALPEGSLFHAVLWRCCTQALLAFRTPGAPPPNDRPRRPRSLPWAQNPHSCGRTSVM